MKASRAFSIVELLVILVILTAILAPVFRAARRSGQVSAAESQLRQLYLAVELYRTEHDGGESGTGSQMGYPPPEAPVATVWPSALWKSPCGIHPDFVDGAPVRFTYEFSPYAGVWPEYHELLGSNSALIRDSQCDDFSHTLSNPYVTHLGLAVRSYGSLWRQRARGDLLSLRFWGLPQTIKEQ